MSQYSSFLGQTTEMRLINDFGFKEAQQKFKKLSQNVANFCPLALNYVTKYKIEKHHRVTVLKKFSDWSRNMYTVPQIWDCHKMTGGKIHVTYNYTSF